MPHQDKREVHRLVYQRRPLSVDRSIPSLDEVIHDYVKTKYIRIKTPNGREGSRGDIIEADERVKEILCFWLDLSM